VTTAAAAFFVKLRCNAASKEEEEGDGSNATIACFITLQCNSTTESPSFVALQRSSIAGRRRRR